MLSDKIEHYKKYKKMLNNTPAQYKEEFPWLKEVDSIALSSANRNLQKAFNNFFKRPEIGFPRFKSKKNNNCSYTTYNSSKGNIYIKDNHIKLPKVGLVRLKRHRDFNGIIKGVTVSKTPSGKYFVSIAIKYEDIEKMPKIDSEINIEIETNEFEIIFNNERIKFPNYFIQSEKRLIKLQKDLLRCKNGSKNRDKCRIKFSKQHEKIVNKRKDFLHKLSKRIICENQTVILKNYDVKNMIKNNNISKMLSDLSWGRFVRQLEYKANWYGREIIKI